MRISKKKNRFTLKKLAIVAGVLLLILGVLVILEKENVTKFYTKSPKPTVSEDKTTSQAPSAQEEFTDGGDREDAGTNTNEGTVSDTKGETGNAVDPSTWTTSSQGKIVLHGPTRNALFTSGSYLSGTSELPKVSFRLIDDVTGVIAQGDLTVVGGKFSGTFSFNTSATNGRIDVFGTDNDGVESNNIEVPIRFK